MPTPKPAAPAVPMLLIRVLPGKPLNHVTLRRPRYRQWGFFRGRNQAGCASRDYGHGGIGCRGGEVADAEAWDAEVAAWDAEVAEAVACEDAVATWAAASATWAAPAAVVRPTWSAADDALLAAAAAEAATSPALATVLAATATTCASAGTNLVR